jgi:hypothetical protein
MVYGGSRRRVGFTGSSKGNVLVSLLRGAADPQGRCALGARSRPRISLKPEQSRVRCEGDGIEGLTDPQPSRHGDSYEAQSSDCCIPLERSHSDPLVLNRRA